MADGLAERFTDEELSLVVKCLELFETHEEGFSFWCDTGADMDWACRSDCTRHGADRVRKYFGIL